MALRQMRLRFYLKSERTKRGVAVSRFLCKPICQHEKVLILRVIKSINDFDFFFLQSMHILSLYDDSPSLLYFTNLKGWSHLQRLALSTFFFSFYQLPCHHSSDFRAKDGSGTVRSALWPHCQQHRVLWTGA